MNTAGSGAMCCAHCGRPAATLVWLGGLGYHAECTRGPGWQEATYQAPPLLPVQHYTTPMSEERVRLIVRDEMQRSGLMNSPNA